MATQYGTREVWTATLKSVQRPVALQSGFPIVTWHWSLVYSAIILAICQPAPILPTERDEEGNVFPEHKHKVGKSCWQVHHYGETFKGPIQPFGRLCFYLDKQQHTLAAQASAGLFLGWKIESGC